MVFSTPIFLFYFLVLTLLIYYLVPRKFRNVVILCASLFFYAWGEPVYIVIMFLSIAIDYTHGMLVEQCKAQGQRPRGPDGGGLVDDLQSGAAVLLQVLGLSWPAPSRPSVWPSCPCWASSLPIGISFYTFQTMSYTIDVYRGDARAQRSIINFGTFVTLFPQLIAGPIIKYKDLGDQIDHRDCHCGASSPPACRSLWWAWAKKVLLANNVGMLWDAYKAMPAGPAHRGRGLAGRAGLHLPDLLRLLRLLRHGHRPGPDAGL